MDPSSFIVKQEYFDHSSWLHGVGHTCRVMAIVWTLGGTVVNEYQRDLAFCAAFIHDFARSHDGVCREHGPRAAEEKLPIYTDFFLQQGIQAADIQLIKTAVHYHSLVEELDRSDTAYPVTALLKDADALDRIRLGPFNLDPQYLRYGDSRKLIRPAQQFFLRTVRCQENDPSFFIRLFQRILNSKNGKG